MVYCNYNYMGVTYIILINFFLSEDLESHEIETENKTITISVKSNDQGRFFKLIEVTKSQILQNPYNFFFNK